MKNMSTKGIVFDLFQTLVDPEEFRPKEYRRAQAAADILGLDKVAFFAYWKETQQERMTTSKPELQYVKDFVVNSGKTPPSSRALERADEALGCYEDLALLKPRKDVVAPIKRLASRGYRLGLLSNTYERFVREWPNSPLASSFDATAFSDEIGVMKPERKAYVVILRRLRLDAKVCAYVGDGGSQELIGAKGAGFRRVVFMKKFVSRNGMKNAEELQEIAGQADVSVDDFEDLERNLA
jgi:putative hydrolase of the HAD superfamily